MIGRYENLAGAFSRGISAFGVPRPVTLPRWAMDHFYLSAESSYVEGKWRPWPFQVGLMVLIGDDDIREVTLRKSARVGYTKMLLADIGYTAHHQRRNQALWQPSDDDAKEFVKTELDPMIRDVPAMRDVFPAYLKRDKDNTLDQKKFTGSMLYVRGGKAAKNYRRISVDKARLDELDAFDQDVEKEGAPTKLASKRTEGATFPKLICGTTPKLKGFSLIEDRESVADVFLRFAIPCPECGEYHPITFGGRDEPHGFKWTNRDPDSVRHLCPHCGALIEQSQYLEASESGRWQTDGGATWLHIDPETLAGEFRDASGKVATPEHVAAHVWSAYSPVVSWPSIVKEFLDAADKAERGRSEAMKTFRNTTLGESYADETDQAAATDLQARAEPYELGTVPRGCLLLLAGCDTQDNRIEVGVWGFGREGEMWAIAHHIVWGDPDKQSTMDDLAEYLFETEFTNEFGRRLRIEGSGIDSGGHKTQAVYEFARKHKRRRVLALKGHSGRERHIKQGASLVDIDYKGRKIKQGVMLWSVSTNMAKDRLFSRLQTTTPGHGYIHFSDGLTEEWFAQFTGESRTTKRMAGGDESKWTANRPRVEAWDCAAYAVFMEEYGDGRTPWYRKPDEWWEKRKKELEPENFTEEKEVIVQKASAGLSIGGVG